MSKDRLALLISLIVILAGCTQPANVTDTPSAPTANQTVETLLPGTPTAGAILETPEPFTLCSPLSDIPLPELQTIISNPFAPLIRLGSSEGGHHGTDFAYYTHPDTGKVMLGAPIQVVMAGRVASVSTGKAPYGNLIIIETPLRGLPEDIQVLFKDFPKPTPSVAETLLTCPRIGESTEAWDVARPSLYVLYAHMNSPADYQIGDEVVCGEIIGQVGNTGRSGNPHLHLEMRYGPGGASFISLAHYSGNATLDEMATYCTWRVSGNFQAVDPMRVLETAY